MMTPWDRYGLIVRLAQAMPYGTTMGRTALMKLAYFLQTAKQVPLGYRFSLYTYGPFDSDVLADLSQVQEMGGVRSKTVMHSAGYGYEITPGDEAETILSKARGYVAQHESKIQEVVGAFSSYTPAQLELASTILFASREDTTIDKDALLTRVRKIKPRFSPEQVDREYETLKNMRYVTA